jgi:hypothetical protein
MDIETVYLDAGRQPSEINEHLTLLHYYALSCQHVTEFGLRLGVFTVCFIHARPIRLESYRIPTEPSRMDDFRKPIEQQRLNNLTSKNTRS